MIKEMQQIFLQNRKVGYKKQLKNNVKSKKVTNKAANI